MTIDPTTVKVAQKIYDTLGPAYRHTSMALAEELVPLMPRALSSMGDQVVEWCVRKGWEPDPARTFGDECALLTSEISEALEAYRSHKFEDFTEEWVDGAPQPKPEGVGSEFADVLVRLLHYATTHGIDLQAEFDRKMAYNEGRPWRHGGRVM